MRPVAIVSGVLSLIVPGLGQLARRRWVEAALFLMTACYFRLLLTGLAGDAEPGARVSGLFFGAFGVTGGVRNPTYLVFTVLTIGLHALAVWDAMRTVAAPPGETLGGGTASEAPEEVKAGEAT